METIKLSKAVTYNGKELEELSFDFEKLTGRDSLEVEAELSRHGTIIAAKAFNGQFLVRMAARACTERVGVDLFYQMNVKDFNDIEQTARAFFLGNR